jgi:hypothetical protein
MFLEFAHAVVAKKKGIKVNWATCITNLAFHDLVMEIVQNLVIHN